MKPHDPKQHGNQATRAHYPATTSKLLDLLHRIDLDRQRFPSDGQAWERTLRFIEHWLLAVPIEGAPTFHGPPTTHSLARYFRQVEAWAIPKLVLPSTGCEPADVATLLAKIVTIVREAESIGDVGEAWFWVDRVVGRPLVYMRNTAGFVAEMKLRQRLIRGDDVSRELQAVQDVRRTLAEIQVERDPVDLSKVTGFCWNSTTLAERLERLQGMLLPAEFASLGAGLEVSRSTALPEVVSLEGRAIGILHDTLKRGKPRPNAKRMAQFLGVSRATFFRQLSASPALQGLWKAYGGRHEVSPVSKRQRRQGQVRRLDKPESDDLDDFE